MRDDMHDIRFIRDTPELFDAAMRKRGEDVTAAEILALDKSRREKIAAAEALQSSLNKVSKEVGAAKARGDEDEFARLRDLVSAQKGERASLEEDAKAQDAKLTEMLASYPNIPLDDVPLGADEADNVEIHTWGEPRKTNFAPKEHFEVAGAAQGLDFEAAAKLSGARFVVMRGAMIRLHRALAQFMLDTHINENGLTETWTPVLVREDAMYGTGQLPKFSEDSYQTTNGWWLIPTSEVTLTNLAADKILDEAELPIRMTAHTQCFRSEAGSAGKDTTGMLRQHQFEKVEMVSITKPEDSRAELDRMTSCAQGILEKLGLAYRTLVLCVGDMGFGAQRTHDIEVWLPGQNTYREISSCSVCGGFQARRMNARYRPASGEKPMHVHTLNGSGLAVGRCLIAVIENYQQEDGSIQIPDVLQTYVGGHSVITADGTFA
jgi:seryl-tRNA synthetase